MGARDTCLKTGQELRGKHRRDSGGLPLRRVDGCGSECRKGRREKGDVNTYELSWMWC